MPAPDALLEAAPNASEGRDPERIARLVAAIGPPLADTHSDAAHNRSVFTLFGTEAELFAAACRLFQATLASVRLDRHRGEHPRIGALDVLPFIPIGPESRMEDAARLARRTGAALADRWDVPVFLYGDAARGRPLREIRRGGLEGLGRRLAAGTARPDYGPPRLHPTAGAVAVGARRPLVAFNVNLDSGDVHAARSIAGAVRETGGGLPGVRALGVRVRTGAQVTMNVERVEETPLSLVFERVREAARQQGLEVLGSEIVGLVPEAAAWPGMAEELRLPAPPRTIEGVLRTR